MVATLAVAVLLLAICFITGKIKVIMKTQKLSYEDFLLSLRLCPRLSLELILEHPREGVLFILRTKTPFENNWHLPGGFLLKGESIADCFKRISKDELGRSVEVERGEFLGVFENVGGDPRGHILHYVSRFKVKDSKQWLIPTKEGKKAFFKKLPKKTIPYQRDFLSKLDYR